MRRIFTISLFFLAFFVMSGLSHCRADDISNLVDTFQKSTDLQRNQLLDDNLGKDFTAGGVVANVGEYDLFDIVNDTRGTYYQVITQPQKTTNKVPYQVTFLFKDKNPIENINRGDNFQKDGKVVRIDDERLQIAVWLLCGELTEKDKSLFRQRAD